MLGLIKLVVYLLCTALIPATIEQIEGWTE